MKVFLLFILIVNGVFAGERLYRPEHFSLSLLEKELVHENIGFLEGRGVRALELGDYVLAIQYFTKVAFIEPKRTSVNYYLGETERRLGNGAGAVKYFREIVAEERGEALFYFFSLKNLMVLDPRRKRYYLDCFWEKSAKASETGFIFLSPFRELLRLEKSTGQKAKEKVRKLERGIRSIVKAHQLYAGTSG